MNMKTIALKLFAVVIFAGIALAGQAQTTCSVAQLTSPAPGSTLPGSTATFNWCNASADYFLTVESVQGAHDIFNAIVRVNSITLINLPTNGGKVFMTLWTQVQGQWQSPFNYTFNAAGANPLPQPAADYSLNASSTKVSVSAAQSGSAQVSMTALNGFDGTVTFNCAGLPANVHCQFTPAQLAGSNIPVTTTLVVSETPVAANRMPARSPRGPASRFALWSLGVGAFGMVFAGSTRRRRTRLLPAAALLLLLVQLAACGGAASTPPANPPNPGTAQTVSATVVAAATGGTRPASIPTHEFQMQITMLP